LTDKEFWDLSEQISEPNGEFQSDNFLSNERGYQIVIPELIKSAKSGRVYLGVGPEQNYPYILALKPAMAIIFDVRRGNLHEQLLYKALFEMSTDRADFLGRLFSRKRPMDSRRRRRRRAFCQFGRWRATTRSYTRGTDVSTAPRLKLTQLPGDLRGIDYVYRIRVLHWRPDLTTWRGAGARRQVRRRLRRQRWTYAVIQALDVAGAQQGLQRWELAWR
jgi:hypothetical protein